MSVIDDLHAIGLALWHYHRENEAVRTGRKKPYPGTRPLIDYPPVMQFCKRHPNEPPDPLCGPCDAEQKARETARARAEERDRARTDAFKRGRSR